MDNLTQELLEALVNKSKSDNKVELEDVLRVFLRSEIEKGINSVIEHEFDAFLGYEKNEQGASKKLGNSRNGKYSRILNTSYGQINVEVPRDRNSDFQTGVFEKHKRSTNNITQMVLKMYNAGFTDSEIQEFIECLYHHKYSTSTISKITDAVQEDVEKFKNFPLKKNYFALFIDSTYVPLRRNTVEKEAINIVMGIDMEGFPEVLAFSITPSETKDERNRLLENLKNRGLDTCRILISDGFTGIEELVKTHFPSCLYQRCYIHIIRNLCAKVRKNDQYELSREFASLAKLDTLDEALKQYDSFIEKWSNKYRAIKDWASSINKNSLFNFYKFPKELRGRIYTNNRIEGFNKQIKRQAKAHITRSTQDAEEKFLVSLFLRYNLNVGKRKIHNADLLDRELI